MVRARSYYRGEAYYRTSLPASSCKGARYLVFEGVGQSAHVIAAGDTLCYHSGAYTHFYVDITGKDYRQIEVACENTQNLDRIPLTSDFNKNGGIHYPAWVLDCPDVHFSPQKYGFAPVLLLDDVFDKLDMGRISNLLQMVASNDFGQIFITDSNKVRMSGIVDGLTQDRAYFEAVDGAFTRI